MPILISAFVLLAWIAIIRSIWILAHAMGGFRWFVAGWPIVLPIATVWALAPFTVTMTAAPMAFGFLIALVVSTAISLIGVIKASGLKPPD